MKVTIEADVKWYCFQQNNSGGYFVENENVAPTVFIQARNAAEAIDRGEKFMDNGDSCPCCGDRWSFYVDDEDGREVPTVYDTPYTEYKGWGRTEARLHHFDGRVETVKPTA